MCSATAAAAAQEGGDLNTRRSTQRRTGMYSTMPNAIYSGSEPDTQENNRWPTVHIDGKVCQRGIIANVVRYPCLACPVGVPWSCRVLDVCKHHTATPTVILCVL